MSRAEVILASRDEKEVLAIAKILDNLDTEDDLEEWARKLTSDISKIKESNELDQILKLPMSHAKYLANCIESHYFDIDDQPIKAKIEEYFAVLCLALIGQAYCEQLNIADEPTSTKKEKRNCIRIGSSIIGATEAVTYAESILMSKRVEKAAHDREQTKRSDIARKAGKASQENTSKLAQELYNFYIENNYNNFTVATEEYLLTLPEERYKHLAPSNRIRTLRERLSKLVKESK
ncbi:MAG: hypothetical protein JAZ12_02100 [Candidatus Thiodiazotropha taylori]|nr:hypothetical protein [Candidatus Thiodiazotropha taylori]